MRNLILLFVRYGGFFLFLFLEIFCFFLIIRYNQSQRQIFWSSAQRISGKTQAWFGGMTDYLDLKVENDSLAQTVAELREQIHNQDLVLAELQPNAKALNGYYHFIEAKVVNNSVIFNNNSLTINKGSKAGIAPHMGVVNDQGVVGIVRNVSQNFAQVMSLLHRQTRISASVKRNGFFGSLIWESSDPTKMSLKDIPKHANLQVGDTVQTSGYSAIFPEGIHLGEIDTFWLESGSNFYDVTIKISNDLANTKYVYVIDDLNKEEKQSLEQSNSNE